MFGLNIRFSKNRPLADSFIESRNLRVCVSLFKWYILRPIFPPLPEVGCPKFLEIRNPWGKVLERSGLKFEHFSLEVVQNHQTIDFALQNMVETRLSDGFETSGRRAFR